MSVETDPLDRNSIQKMCCNLSVENECFVQEDYLKHAFIFRQEDIKKKVGFQIDFAWTDLKNENICKLKLKCDEKKNVGAGTCRF